jgi:hypothetical protein
MRGNEEQRINRFDDNLDLTGEVLYLRQMEPYLSARDPKWCLPQFQGWGRSGAYLNARDGAELVLTSKPGMGPKWCLPQCQGWGLSGAYRNARDGA